MADSKTPRNIKASKEDSSTDQKSSLSSWSSCSSHDQRNFYPGCKRQLCESKSESSSGNDESEIDAYDSSWTDFSNLSDTMYSSSGSGYMSASSSLDESSQSSEDSSDTSSYFCDRSASSSSCSDTDDFSPKSEHENNCNFISSPRKELPKTKLFYCQREE